MGKSILKLEFDVDVCTIFLLKKLCTVNHILYLALYNMELGYSIDIMSHYYFISLLLE